MFGVSYFYPNQKSLDLGDINLLDLTEWKHTKKLSIGLCVVTRSNLYCVRASGLSLYCNSISEGSLYYCVLPQCAVLYHVEPSQEKNLLF